MPRPDKDRATHANRHADIALATDEAPKPVEERSDLTAPEQEQLRTLEQTIERGLQTFMEVGTALIVIREQRLYRQEYGTFEEYCTKRWGMGRSRAYQIIDAAGVVENLQAPTGREMSTIVDILPANEAQARPLAKLEPQFQREAWKDAVETAKNPGKPTAAEVTKAAAKYKPPTPPPSKVVYTEPQEKLQADEPVLVDYDTQALPPFYPELLEIVPGVIVRPFGELWRATDKRDERNTSELVDPDRERVIAWAMKQAGVEMEPAPEAVADEPKPEPEAQPSAFDAWLAAMPPITSTAECLAWHRASQEVTRRTVELEPSVFHHAGNLKPPLRQLIIALAPKGFPKQD